MFSNLFSRLPMKELSNDELNSFLNEINQKEAAELPSEYADGKWEYVQKDGKLVPSTREEADKARKKALTALQEKKIERKKRKQEIIHEAINSTFIDLNSLLTVEHKKLLISILTNQYTECMKRHESYINSTVEKLLRLLMPRDILNSWNKYRDTMVPSPGFIYEASEEYGQGLTFKVNLDLPMYFKQDTCMNILKEHFSYQLPVIDKAVAFFHKHKDMRTKQEVKYAQRLTKISTFFQLVKHNAFWYEKLITELKNKELCT